MKEIAARIRAPLAKVLEPSTAAGPSEPNCWNNTSKNQASPQTGPHLLDRVRRFRLECWHVSTRAAAARHCPPPACRRPEGMTAIVSSWHEEGGATHLRPQREESSRTPGRARPRPGACTRAGPYIDTDEQAPAINSSLSGARTGSLGAGSAGPLLSSREWRRYYVRSMAL
jgi:hypothetical protein